MRVAIAFAVVMLLTARGANAMDRYVFKPSDCKKDVILIELAYCSDLDFKKADKSLNALYRQMMPRYGAADQALLKDAQRKWLAYRDAECAFETNLSVGGTIHPVEEIGCRTTITNARIKELEVQLKCAEGDTSCNPPDK